MFDPERNSMNSKENDMIEQLILNGALEVAGVDSEDGSILYCFTPKIKEVMPELYNEHINNVNSELLALWEKGYLNIDFLAEDPIITPAQKSFNQEELSKLSKHDRWSIEEIKRLSRPNPRPN